jgi:hypothetical protein
MNKFFISLIGLGLTLVASPVLAEIAGPTSEIEDLPRGESFIPIIVTVILWAMVYAFALSVLIIIIAGIMYTTSASNPEIMERAKKTLQYAITGLVISLVGYFIVLGISGILFGDIVGGVFGIFG